MAIFERRQMIHWPSSVLKEPTAVNQLRVAFEEPKRIYCIEKGSFMRHSTYERSVSSLIMCSMEAALNLIIQSLKKLEMVDLPWTCPKIKEVQQFLYRNIGITLRRQMLVQLFYKSPSNSDIRRYSEVIAMSSKDFYQLSLFHPGLANSSEHFQFIIWYVLVERDSLQSFPPFPLDSSFLISYLSTHKTNLKSCSMAYNFILHNDYRGALKLNQSLESIVVKSSLNSKFLNLIRTNCKLKRLTISSLSDKLPSDAVTSFFDSQKDCMEEVVIESDLPQPAALNFFYSCLEMCQNLKRLTVQKDVIKKSSNVVLNSVMELNVSFNKVIERLTFQDIEKIATSFPNLKRLHFSGIPPGALNMDLTNTGINTKLVSISSDDYDPHVHHSWTEMMQSCPNLEQVSIQITNGSAMYEDLMSVLKRCKNLVKFSLSSETIAQFDVNDFREQFESRQICQQINELSIVTASQTPFASLEAVEALLTWMPKLSYVSNVLSWCEIRCPEEMLELMNLAEKYNFCFKTATPCGERKWLTLDEKFSFNFSHT